MMSPVFLAAAHCYSMNVFDRSVLGRRDPGAASRVGPLGKETLARPRLHARPGLLNKISILWLCGGLFVGLALTSHRRLWSSPESGSPLSSARVIAVPIFCGRSRTAGRRSSSCGTPRASR